MLIYLVILLVTIVILYFKNKHRYWKNRNVPHHAPRMPFGNAQSFFNMSKSIGVQVKDFYDHFKNLGEKHAGYYIIEKAIYLPIDLDIIKNITTKDFSHFNEKPFYSNGEKQPISVHLFNMGGEKWKSLRQKLTPTFTSGKMKMMFGTLLQCREPLLETVAKLAENHKPMDIKEIASSYTTDVIGSVAFGIDCNSFKDPDAEFRKYGREIFEQKFWQQVKATFAIAFPDVAKKIGIVMFPRTTEAFFSKVVKDTIKYREDNKITRNDFMQLLINIKNTGTVDATADDSAIPKTLTVDEVIGQAFIFFLAGFETSGTTMTFCLYELAQNQEIQDRVRKEIDVVLKKHNGEISYEALLEMKYMRQVIDETLRKYPPVPTIDRRCNKNYKVPNTDLVIEKGTSVSISALGLQRDPEYFPDPEKFDPERFSEENVSSIIPYTYMPFGEGPRVCIGLRFGIMQTQVGLITFLQNYRYTLNKNMSPNPTFALGFILAFTDDVLLDVTKIK